MASRRALWVLGGVRLISSASMMFEKIGPSMKVHVRCPVASSSMMSVPVMSLGIRSGVNWMRLKTSPSVWAMVRTRRVFAVPGSPVIRQWPPTKRPIITCSRTSSWPTITRRTCVTICDCTWRKRSMRDLNTSGSNCGVTVVDMDSFLFLFGSRPSSTFRTQLQQQFLGLPVARGGIESRQQFVLCLLDLFVHLQRTRQVVMGSCRVIRLIRCHGTEFPNRAGSIVQVQPESAQFLVCAAVHQVDVVQAVQHVRGFFLFAGLSEI